MIRRPEGPAVHTDDSGERRNDWTDHFFRAAAANQRRLRQREKSTRKKPESR